MNGPRHRDGRDAPEMPERPASKSPQPLTRLTHTWPPRRRAPASPPFAITSLVTYRGRRVSSQFSDPLYGFIVSY